jgi:phosphoribosylformimino-5-aminoimidazole carboxamide ribotide isomerase
LSDSVNPVELASVFKSVGFNNLYLADLDSILGKSSNLEIYGDIVKNTNLTLMVDAGLTDIAKAYELIDIGISKIIIGSETLKSLDFVNRIVNDFGENRVIVSIDHNNEKIISTSKVLASMDIFSFIGKLEGMGIKTLILLDLCRVGTASGINFSFLRNVFDQFGVEIIVGGGISKLDELLKLKKIGVSGALIATALHNGNILSEQLAELGFLI